MKALVTGGAGFIGSNLTDKLIEKGLEVCILDNLSSGLIEQVNPKAKFYLTDVRSEEVAKIFEIEKPDIVFHLAAQMSVPFSVKEPKLDLDINGKGILNLLQASVKTKVRKFIFSSTGGAIYGDASQIPTPESETPRPLSPYGITKLLGENYLRFYNENYGLDFTVLRYSNVYGPRQLNAHESGVVTIFINGILDEKPLKIYAYDDEPDGMIRDYIYVGDVVSANIAAIKSESGIYNIGTSVSTRTKEIFDSISEISGKSVDYGVFPPREGDIRANTLSIELAKEELGWKPEFDLRSGMEQTLNYFKEIRK